MSSNERGNLDPIYFTDNRHRLDFGVRKPRFRSARTIMNRGLYALLLVLDIKPSELAKMVGVTSRSVAAWLYDGVRPSEKNQDTISKVLEYPVHILFPDFKFEDIKISIPVEGKFYWRVITSSPVAFKILAGMFALHDLPFNKTCEYIGVSPCSMGRYIHKGKLPTVQYMMKIADFFEMPAYILFAEYFMDEKQKQRDQLL
jgi:transcriptional regulator with XRE-family HTH domain